jgi:crossover junction endodeoxyribonuclease RuvC
VKVLGIDPGIKTTGYGVVERAGPRHRAVALGVIRTPASLAHADRLAALQRDVTALISEHDPEVMAIERLFFNSNVRTAMAVGQASGVALAAAARAGLEVFTYTPPEVKQSVAGVGSAPKSQVQAMVAAILGLAEAPKPPDAADACALAICHINRSGLARALKAAGA